MVKKIVGGVVALVIGGTTFAISKSDIVNNFSKDTGMTKQQAQQYIDNIPKSDLETFSKVGQSFVSDGNDALKIIPSIDCVNYTYKWESDTLSCDTGKSQLQTIGNDEITLGNCYQSLDTNLGNSAKTQIQECITDINTIESDYRLPIATALLDSGTITDSINTNAYNKSVLEAALQSK